MIFPLKKPDLDTCLTIFLLVLFGALSWGAYAWAYNRGAASVQTQWDRAREAQQVAATKLQLEYAGKEAVHRQNLERVTDALNQANTKHEQALVALRADFARRLQSSEARAGVYQRQAEAGPAQCRDLASHAARLDQSLEEGRSLVWELRATLGQRDQQIRLLGTQLLNDRQLLSDDGN